jgi:hypothetical protein
MEENIKNLAAGVFLPEDEADKTEERAKEIAAELGSKSNGIALFEDENGNKIWGVLVRGEQE